MPGFTHSRPDSVLPDVFVHANSFCVKMPHVYAQLVQAQKQHCLIGFY